MDPSENSCQAQEFFNFLKNDFNRKQYNTVIKWCKEYHIWQAKNGFLKQLIENKIITKYYRVKNKGNDTMTEAAINTSLEWMKIDLERNESKEQELFDNLMRDYNFFVCIIPPHLRDFFKEKVAKRGQGFRKYYTSEKVKRFGRLIDPRQNKKTSKNEKKWIFKTTY